MDSLTLQTTAEISPTKTSQEVIKEAKRIEEASLFSAKGHFIAAEWWSSCHRWIGIPNAGLAALAGALMLSFSDSNLVRLVAGVLSLAAAVLAAIQVFLNPNEKAAVHLNAGNSYDALNGRARIFWTIECWEEQPSRLLTEKLKDLAVHKEKLNHSCPQIPSWAYKHAREAIEDGEGTYTVDKIPGPSSPPPPS